MPIKNPYGFGEFNASQIKNNILPDLEADLARTVLFRRPDAAPDPSQFIKTIPINEVKDIVPDSFAGSVGLLLIQNMTMAQMEQIGVAAHPYLKVAIRITLERGLRLKPSDVNLNRFFSYVNQSPSWQI